MQQLGNSSQFEFVCQNLDHKNEPIIGFCFNEQCDKSSQVCFKCFTSTHGRHQSDCLRFQEIQQLIQSQQGELDQLAFENQQIFTRIQQQQTKNEKFLNMYKSNLQNLNECINQGQFGMIRSEIPSLKWWRQISLRQMNKKNDIYVKLDEIQKFSKAVSTICDEFQIDKLSMVNQSKITSNLDQSSNRQSQQNKGQSSVTPQEMNALAIQSLNQAVELFQQQKLDEALKFIEISLTQNYDFAQTHFLKGVILSNQEKNEEAVDTLTRAIRLDPNLNSQMYFVKAQCLYQIDKANEAIESLDQAIKMEPQQAKYYILKAQCLQHIDQFQEAVEYYDQALKLQPNQPNILANKGSALHQLGKYGEELQCYEIALQSNPNLPNAWHNKGTALMQLNRNDEAIKSFEQAIKLRPNFPQSYTYQGICLQKVNQHEKAIQQFDKSYELHQDDQIILLKGNSLNALGRNDEAIKLYEVYKLRND